MSAESPSSPSLLSLTDISIYPIKSVTGLSVDSCDVSPMGLTNDRTYMLVDDNGVFISQRKYPKMALIKVRRNNRQLNLNAPEMPELEITEVNPRSIQVEVWGTQCHGHVASEPVNQWFSRLLGISVRLVQYDEQKPRIADPDYSQNGDIVSFADGFPLLVIAQASLDDLNRRLSSPVAMTNFRPNIVVDGCDAYAEDHWKQIKVGEVVFDAVKQCSRCVLTTVNPNTGEKRQDKEPLKTLSEYRRAPGGVYFGNELDSSNTRHYSHW